MHKTIRKCHLSVLLSVLLSPLAAFGQTTTLISDPFNTSGALNGTTPPITVGGASWVAQTGTSAASGVLTLPGSNQTDTIDLGANFFSSNPGVYSVSMDVTLPAGTSSLNGFGLGFVANPITAVSMGSAASNPGLNPAGGANGGTPWMYLVQAGRVYVNRAGGTFIYQSAIGAYPSGSVHNMKLVLDTSTTQWTMTAYIDSVQVDLNGGLAGLAYTFTTNPTDIRYVAISSTTSVISASVDNFILTGPSQNTLPPPNNPLLISDAFSTSGALNGTTPGTTVANVPWIAYTGSGFPSSNGSVLSLPGHNQSNVIDLGNKYFSSHPGTYTLSMDATLPTGTTGSNYFGLGFVVNPLSGASGVAMTSTSSSAGLNPNGGTNGGTPWMAINQNGQVYVYRGGSTYIYASAASAFPIGTAHTLKLILDTTQVRWTMNAFVDATQLDLNGSTTAGLTYTFPSNPTDIRYAGMTAGTGTTTATIDNFALNYVPDPDLPRIGDLAAPGIIPGSRPYSDLWLEGESFTSQTGGSTVADASGYGGQKWVVASSTPGASATYTVNIPSTGKYLLNIAGSPIGAPTSSPLAYAIDGGSPTLITGGTTSSRTWSSGGLMWSSAAILNFTTTGSHTITISLAGPRASDGTYAFTIDAIALVADPFDNLLYTETNFAQPQLWSATVAASTSNVSYPAANVTAGNPALGWEPTVASPGTSTLTITFPTARALEVLRLVKGLNAPSGASMPTAYTIELLEGGTWTKRVSETGNLKSDIAYQMPGIISATAMRLTITATTGTNFPFVNQFEAYGPFCPAILSPLDTATVRNPLYNVCGFTQPNASVALRINGATGTTVTADASGWFSGNLTFVTGANTIQAQSTLSTVSSIRQSSTVTYNASAAAGITLVDRKGAHVIVDEGVNKVAVTGLGQGSAVAYTIKNEAGTTLTSSTIDLSQGGALLSLPSSTAGWYQINITGSPALAQTVSVLPNHFVLPNLSNVASNFMLDGRNLASAAEQAAFFPVVIGYASMSQIPMVRDPVSWSSVNTSLGVNDWRGYDARIDSFLAQGQKVLSLISTFPPFLNSHNDYQYVPDDLRETYNWAQVLATHYQGRVSAYEFQNEYDYAGTAKQTVNTLMAHQRAFYLGVKSVDPAAIVVTNAPAFVADAANQAQNLRGEAADVFAFHWYPANSGATQISNLQATGTYNMPDSMSQVTRYLENRASWLTECGYYGTVGSEMTAADEGFQADFYSKMAPLAMSYGVAKSFAFVFPWYPEGVKQFGMLRSTGFSPRPAVNSSATTAEQLRSAKYYGKLTTGNSNITGLVFQNTDGTYVLELWATAAGGTGAYTLPGSITQTRTVDYLGRLTDAGTPTSVVVQTTAKFLTLNGSGVTAVTTATTNPVTNENGVAPSPIVMGWHFNLPCKSAPFEDFYDVAQTSSTSCSLEAVNLSASSFTGTIAAFASNSRWTLTPGASLTVTIPANGRVTIPFTLVAPTLKDNVRVEARVDDASGKASSAAEILQTTGTTPLPTAVQPDGSGNLTLACPMPFQNYYAYVKQLRWTSGTDGTVNYMAALPSTGIAYTSAQMFKAPRLDFLANFTSVGTYYVWVKAKAGPAATNQINIGVNGNLLTTGTGITGFNTSGWTWSRTLVTSANATYVNSSAGNRTLNVWPTNDGIQIAYVFCTTNSAFTPTF